MARFLTIFTLLQNQFADRSNLDGEYNACKAQNLAILISVFNLPLVVLETSC